MSYTHKTSNLFINYLGLIVIVALGIISIIGSGGGGGGSGGGGPANTDCVLDSSSLDNCTLQ